MSDNPMKRAGKFQTAEINDQRQRDDAIRRALALYQHKRAGRLEALDEAARELVQVAERKTPDAIMKLAVELGLAKPEIPDLEPGNGAAADVSA